jgi:hypothetical protein
MKGMLLDLTGHRYGRLVVRSLSPQRTAEGKARWLCLCDCGATTDVAARNLRSGSVKSCGCHRRERIGNLTKTHGLSKTPEAEAWRQMRSRCNNPNHPNYADYGGRGIYVCAEWDSFEQFLADMGQRPTPEHSLDRHPDNDGPYSKANCRWATVTEQNRNTRGNTVLTHHGLSMTVTEWAQHLGLHPQTLCERLKRWPVQRALAQPLDRRYSHPR